MPPSSTPRLQSEETEEQHQILGIVELLRNKYGLRKAAEKVIDEFNATKNKKKKKLPTEVNEISKCGQWKWITESTESSPSAAKVATNGRSAASPSDAKRHEENDSDSDSSDSSSSSSDSDDDESTVVQVKTNDNDDESTSSTSSSDDDDDDEKMSDVIPTSKVSTAIAKLETTLNDDDDDESEDSDSSDSSDDDREEVVEKETETKNIPPPPPY